MDRRALPRRGRRAGWWLAVLGLCGLLLAACSGSGTAPSAPSSTRAGTTATPGPAAGPGPTAPLTTVRVAMPTIDLSNLPLALGQWKGWYREVGLDVELVRIGGQAAVPALLNGEVQYLFGWSAAASGIVQDTPIKILAILLDRPLHVVVVQPEIRSVADLRGRRIAISRPGGSDDLIVQAALQTAGLRAEDVEMVRLGETSPRFSGLVAGQVDAAALNQPFTAEAEKQGLKILVRGSDVLRLPIGIIGTTPTYLAAAPDEVRRFLRVVARGLAYLHDPANRPELVPLARAQLDLDPALADALVEETIAILAERGEAPQAVLDAAIDVARVQGGRTEPIPLAGIVDYALFRAAWQEANPR